MAADSGRKFTDEELVLQNALRHPHASPEVAYKAIRNIITSGKWTKEQIEDFEWQLSLNPNPEFQKRIAELDSRAPRDEQLPSTREYLMAHRNEYREKRGMSREERFAYDVNHKAYELMGLSSGYDSYEEWASNQYPGDIIKPENVHLRKGGGAVVMGEYDGKKFRSAYNRNHELLKTEVQREDGTWGPEEW